MKIEEFEKIMQREDRDRNSIFKHQNASSTKNIIILHLLVLTVQ